MSIQGCEWKFPLMYMCIFVFFSLTLWKSVCLCIYVFQSPWIFILLFAEVMIHFFLVSMTFSMCICFCGYLHECVFMGLCVCFACFSVCAYTDVCLFLNVSINFSVPISFCVVVCLGMSPCVYLYINAQVWGIHM